jgi:hypothetical protein
VSGRPRWLAILCVLPGFACAADLPDSWRGVWVFDRDAGAAAVSALDASQVRALLGQTARVEPGAGSFAGQACPTADYQESRQEAAAFRSAFRIAPATLGVSADPIDSLHVECGDDGYDLVAIGPDQAVLIYEGHLFHATRRSGD